MWTRMLRRVEGLMVRRRKRSGEVYFSDTTLRDGEQMPGVRLDPDGKVIIARALAEAGIDSLDAGFPAASKDDAEAIRRIVAEVRGPVITALCRTLRSDVDLAAECLAGAGPYRKGVTLFAGISPQHLKHKHGKSRAQMLELIVSSVAYAKRHFRIVSFGPEDASRADPAFLHEVYREVIAAGATTVGFPDTVGILTPEKAADCIKAIQDSVPNIGEALLGVHFHNDLGLATANALACVAQGVNIVQGTINGLGERAGNTSLEEVALALHLHRDQYKARCRFDPASLHGLGELVSNFTGVPIPPNKPVVGANVFRTEAGIHQDGLLKDVSTYVPYLPEVVGAGPVHLVLGKQSGRHAVRHCLERGGLRLTDAEVELVLDHLKHRACKPVYATEVDFDELLAEVFGPPSAGPRRARDAGAA
ncbi:homocitrate synthase/isopropylmalate synthase family protein [Tundrisphaera sp. TA3]|uniref:homocitrate synthase/isopropylmalate synthase family protein n=1 Tax=Tundrisphaera sp. TA3 TaxID=3435775 RepID=UPI003EBF7B2C